MIRLGVIGMGTRATHIALLLCQEDKDVSVTLVADRDPARARLRERRGRTAAPLG